MRRFCLAAISLLITLSICGCRVGVMTENTSIMPSPDVVSIATIAPEEVSTPAPVSTPGFFKNADVTLNGCNNEGIAFVSGDTLYIPYYNMLCMFDIGNFDSPLNSIKYVSGDEFPYNAYQFIGGFGEDVYCFVNKPLVEGDNINQEIIRYTIERIDSNGNWFVLYEVPEKIDSSELSIYENYWLAGQYIFYNYDVVSHTDGDAHNLDLPVLVRIDMKTGEAIEIEDSGLWPTAAVANDGKFIYYFERSKTTNDYGLYRMDLNCENKECMISNLYSDYLLVNEGRLYYVQSQFDNPIDMLCSVGTDGQDSKELMEIHTRDKWTESTAEGTFYINVAGGYFYYTNTEDNFSLYRVNIDGGQPQKLCVYEHIHQVDIAAGRLFIYDSDYNLVTMLPDGSNAIELSQLLPPMIIEE